MTTITINDRERDTILAALRYWQRDLPECGIEPEFEDIAANGRTGDDAALLPSEIDKLCERINCEGEPQRPTYHELVDGLSDCLSDLDQWASCGPESFTDEERQRRDGYEELVARAAEAAAETPMTDPKLDSDLVRDLWDFIENVTDDDPTRQDQFFALRERVRGVL